ncbi:MAG: DUF1992 domain-containing protein [Chloroflexota bacterium]|nr:DUF1992 domain-containing protein [Chloroflexota bacterium]
MDEISADEIMSKLDRIADRRIQEAIDAGEFDDLAGMGQPLKIEENPFVPPDMRVAYKVLANSGYAPDWMTLAQQIEVDLAQLRSKADRHFAYLRRRLTEISTDPYAIKRLRQEITHLKAEHEREARQHSRAIHDINRNITTFNQTVPISALTKLALRHAEEMAAYEDRVPAYLSYVTTHNNP